MRVGGAPAEGGVRNPPRSRAGPLVRQRLCDRQSAHLKAALVVTLILATAPVFHALGDARQIATIPTSWAVEQGIDSATGQRFCLVVSRGRNVTARLTQESGARSAAWTVIVGHNNSPGSLRYLRIGKAYYTSDRPSFRGGDAKEIMGRLIPVPIDHHSCAH